MELELKHLAAYLPYGVKVSKIHTLNAGEGIGGIGHMLTTKSSIYKLHLRKLSDLTKEIEVNGEKFVPVNKILEIFGRSLKHLSTEYQIKALRAFETDVITKELPYRYIQKLIEWHIDVFSLIPNGLAIDINTLE